MVSRTHWRIGAVLMLAAGSIALAAPAEPPAWAYPMPTPQAALPGADDKGPQHVPDSAAAYTRAQLDDLFSAPDWHPQDHGPMPAVVAQGRKPEVMACGYCHRPDGAGGPENARLAGLPFGYILQQLADFKSGARRSALPARTPQALMVKLSKHLEEADARAAAAYFARLAPRRAITVRESDTVPRTFAPGWFLAPADGGAREPIGRRIIEVPEDTADFERRDARATFIAYVPPGSLAWGAAIAAGAAPGRTPRCATCHGAGLRGQGNVPGIAGRSPSYLVRQLHDIRVGVRRGQAAQAMKGIAARLDADDMLAVAAYVASLEP